MPRPVLIEVPADREAVVRQLLALHDELDALALAAPDGTVLDACEPQVLTVGRDLQRRLLTAAEARRVEAAEKGGPDPRQRVRPGEGEPWPQGPATRHRRRRDRRPPPVFAVPIWHSRCGWVTRRPAVVEGHERAMTRFQPADAATEAAFAVDAGKVCTRQDGWKDLKIAVIPNRVAGEPATPDQWHERSLPASGMVLAFAIIAAVKPFGRT